MMRVLVSFGSKRGGTAGLAAMIGDALTEVGCDAVVRPAKDVGDLGGVDAVSWLAPCTPTGGIATRDGSCAGIPQLCGNCRSGWSAAARWTVRPRSATSHPRRRLRSWPAHRCTWACDLWWSLEPDAKGFPASAMAKKTAGDWRSPAHVRSWVATVVGELQRPTIDRQT